MSMYDWLVQIQQLLLNTTANFFLACILVMLQHRKAYLFFSFLFFFWGGGGGATEHKKVIIGTLFLTFFLGSHTHAHAHSLTFAFAHLWKLCNTTLRVRTVGQVCKINRINQSNYLCDYPRTTTLGRVRPLLRGVVSLIPSLECSLSNRPLRGWSVFI